MSMPPITKPDMIGSGHNSPEAWMMWEVLGHVGNSQDGQAFNRVKEADETQLIDIVGNDIYMGFAVPLSSISLAVWKIKKINTNNPISIYYADGSTFYNKIWSARAGYDYSA